VRWSWYDKNILPQGVEQTCAVPAFEEQRRLIVPKAHGAVLEIGSGTGLNLPHYDAAKVSKIFALDPAPEMHALAKPRVEACRIAVETLVAGCEKIPLEDASVDSVLMTYTLCSVDATLPALEEMRRVLKPGGRMIFVEHGIAPERSVRFWQHLCNPFWAFLSGGCQLTRDIPALIEAGPWRLEGMERGYIPGWRPLNYNFWGEASAR